MNATPDGVIATLLLFPIASLSSAMFWAFLAILLVPSWRPIIIEAFAPARSAHQPYSAPLEALRGLAASIVALAHCNHFTHPVFEYGLASGLIMAAGVKAVPVFAALSGYLIYRAVRPITGVEELRAYALRRFWRIYPLYLFSVVLTLLTGQMIAPDGRFGGVPLVVAEVLMARSIGFPVFANPVAWSLYVEVLFYVLLPVIVLVVGRTRVLPAALVMLALLLVADQIPNREFQLWKFFLFGILAAELAIRHPAWPSGIIAHALLVVGSALVIIDIGGRRMDWLFHLGITRETEIGFTPALGLGLFLVFLALPGIGWLHRLAMWFPLRLIGIVSYSIFLLHPFYIAASFPELLFVKIGQQTAIWQGYPAMPGWHLALAFFPGILAWSIVTHLLIEKPFLALGRRRSVPAAV